MEPLPAAFEQRWARWLLESNQRRTRTALYIASALLPCFGLLDYLLAPPGALTVLWAVRGAVLLATFAMFPLLQTPLFERHPNLIASAYTTLIALSISTMTLFMAGSLPAITQGCHS